MATTVHAEHVGSLLRPRWLLEARAAHKQGTLTSAGLRAAEDRAVLEAWMASGSYEPVAERLFGEAGVDRFLLEYDTERAGGFEPLRFIQSGTTMVLGLVSSKLPRLESPDELQRRIEAASRYVPLADLALSPQCGFASTAGGNQLTVDDERSKLELVVGTASKVWG
jgi:5-methyltetrahydropteroyltriglutamate--homocysteine methyltransferase